MRKYNGTTTIEKNYNNITFMLCFEKSQELTIDRMLPWMSVPADPLIGYRKIHTCIYYF